jgi:predicted phosphodiesterase
MKIAFTSDTHWGITKPKNIVKMLKKLGSEEFDLFIHLGDYSGSTNAIGPLKGTVKAIKNEIGDRPYLSVIGNHDYWCEKKRASNPSIADFKAHYEMVCSIFREHGVHFIDNDGPYRTAKDGSNFLFFGDSGWYKNPNPPTNDKHFLPLFVEGNTNQWLYKKAMTRVGQQIDVLESMDKGSTQAVFLSHFPIVPSEGDYKGAFEDFCWDNQIYNFLKDYGVEYFINGHSHKDLNGPRYECGSDYYNPKYKIIEIPGKK